MAYLQDGEGLSTIIGLLFMNTKVLRTAAKEIGEASELLLSALGPGIVGGLLIPILGAIPDGMIILFSG